MELMKYVHNKQLILLTMITLSGDNCHKYKSIDWSKKIDQHMIMIHVLTLALKIGDRNKKEVKVLFEIDFPNSAYLRTSIHTFSNKNENALCKGKGTSHKLLLISKLSEETSRHTKCSRVHLGGQENK
jgi:hypothetical protein